MSLLKELQAVMKNFEKQAPAEIREVMQQSTQSLIKSGIANNAPQIGEILPNFELPDASGNIVSLSSLLLKGPVVITFYRGGWCPYCNLELRAYQQELQNIKALGASLVAITPESPDESLSTSQKSQLAFDVLSDQDCHYARSIGLTFSLPEELRPIYSQFGIDLATHNNTQLLDLPIPATFVVSPNGKVVSSFVDADYTHRQEPSEVLAVLKKLAR